MIDIEFVAPSLNHPSFAEISTLGLFVFQQRKPLSGMTSLLDWRLCGQLSQGIISGDISGGPDEIKVIQIRKKTPFETAILTGLGPVEMLQDTYDHALTRLFEHEADSNQQSPRRIALALPGRCEEVIEPVTAINLFLQFADQHHIEAVVTIVEKMDHQKLMRPEVEKWRLRHTLNGE